MSIGIKTIDLSAHRALACEFVEECHGHLARKIMERALDVGGGTLKDIADYIRYRDIFGGSSPSAHHLSGANGTVEVSKEIGFKPLREVTDRDVKTAMACLVLHEFVTFNAETQTYHAQLERVLMRFALPAFTRFLRKDHGEAGDLIVSLIGVYGGISLVALESEIARHHPLLLTAAQKAMISMRESGYLSCAGAQGATSSAQPDGRKAGEKQQRMSLADDPTATLPFKINFDAILLEMRAQSILVYVNERYDDFSTSIVRMLIRRDENSSLARRRGCGVWGSSSFTGNNKPNLPPLSSPVSVRQLYEDIVKGSGGSISYDIMRAKVAELCSDDFGSILQTATIGGTRGSREDVVLNYARCVDQMRMNFAEKMVNSRYGIVGTRVMKVLLQRHAVEDRHLAEETISSLNHVREVLIGMFRDGYVKQMDLQKGKFDVNAERNPKNSTFLWTLDREPLLSSVQSHLVTTIRNCRLRNTHEHKCLEEKFPDHSKFSLLLGRYNVVAGGGGASSGGAGEAALTVEEEAALLKMRLSCRALQAMLISQMESLMVMEMYSRDK